MDKNLQKIVQGYQLFRKKYVLGDKAIMQSLSYYGQQPRIMIIACCDSRVDPALLLQCDPGDLFVVRNVANIVPPYEIDNTHHGTSAALEFGVCYLQIEHLILLGHSQCGGIQKLLSSLVTKERRADNNKPDSPVTDLLSDDFITDDFITKWVSLIKPANIAGDVREDECAKSALQQSYHNCLTFPWIRQRLQQRKLHISIWFFDIKQGEIFTYCATKKLYKPLNVATIEDIISSS